ncbi:ankyrin [Aspergillus sclerotiicarbonarius CBS 121057]|uniref:Ankyrin n=1 Tax=Aspergillus sclerotiicarbonarius (strain CBS 121057 / IBT 28362) TaxID=1448318 RepID=A0A319EP27_ASPSB|nr:ankyrin [Aspergillus sclerotiicarbonarius CBS 121057]
MAEALGVASSVVGIVSLAGQVCSGIQELYAFLDSVKEAQADLKCIKDDMLLLQNVIQCIYQDCENAPEHLDVGLLRTSLGLCMSRVNRLLGIVRPLEVTDQKNKTLKALWATTKKKRVADFLKEFDSAKMTLMLVHQHYIQWQSDIEKKRITLKFAEWLAPYRIELQTYRQFDHWTYQLRTWRTINQYSLIFDFCRDGDVKNVQRLFSQRLASPFDVSPDGETVLHYASGSGSPELVSFLLQAGADASAETTDGENAFQYAMTSPMPMNHLALARLFIQQAQIDPMTSGSQRGLIHAYHGPSEVFKYLLHQEQFHIDPNERNNKGKAILHHQILHRLYIGAAVERIQILFAAGHHIQGSRVTDDTEFSNMDGYTPLHCAVKRWAWEKANQNERAAGKAETVVRSLLERGEDVHAVSSRGFTPLAVVGQIIMLFAKVERGDLFDDWLGFLADAGYDLHGYCRVEEGHEERRAVISDFGFLLMFEGVGGDQRPRVRMAALVSGLGEGEGGAMPVSVMEGKRESLSLGMVCSSRRPWKGVACLKGYPEWARSVFVFMLGAMISDLLLRDSN